MNILCDKPNVLKDALKDSNIKVFYSPSLDIYTEKNKILPTLKGMYFSSKLNFNDEKLLNLVKSVAKPSVTIEPKCITCYNFNDFDIFCKIYIDNKLDVKIAYDVETTAAQFLSSKYKLVGFSLASSIDVGCYVILDSIDYHNNDTDKILARLADVLRSHNILVFNAQHEYIATNICVGVDLHKETLLDDAYSMALLLKTESFKSDIFKLKLLCNRLLGLDNWASIIDDYISLAKDIAIEDKYDYDNLNNKQREYYISLLDMLSVYDYNENDIKSFISKIQDSYDEWKDQGTIPYSLIPSKMIATYGCYDSCYLLALFNYFEKWANSLTKKLSDSLNKPDIYTAYKETINSQIMSAILTLNGIFISEDRDNEVKEKSKTLADEHYDKLWEIKSDSTGLPILKEFVKAKFKDILRKKYILPLYLDKLIPDGWEFLKTTSTFYSFECKPLNNRAIQFAELEGIKPSNKGTYKLLQKHLKPFESLDNESELLDSVVDRFIEDSKKNDGSLAVNVFKPMSGPSELYDILNRDFIYSDFMSRVVLYEYSNLPDNLKDKDTTEFLNDNLLYNFDDNKDIYKSVAKAVNDRVISYIKKSYSYKDIYDKLLKEGIKSFSGPIIAYIYNIYTATGCSVQNPKYSVFNFICQLKICRRYLRIISTFIKGASGGYSSQMRVFDSSIRNKYLTLESTSVIGENTNDVVYKENTSNVVFGKWYANVADTGRWTATIHNVPAGAYCKRRFVSRYPGGVILAADMSQMEVRELAMLSNSKKLIETIKDPTIDIHKRTASLAFNEPYDQVTSTQRKQTKQGIFSIVYGRELESLAQNLFKGDKIAAQRLMDAIFNVFPEVPVYLKNALEDAKKHGYLVTRRGAPIFINPYTEGGKDKGDQAFKRNVQNYAIQGGASYICSNVLALVQDLIDMYNMSDKIKIICYIHDSIEIDVAPEAIDMAYKIMYAAFNVLPTKLYNVPCKGDIVIGVSMGEELEFNRINENHYKILGNRSDIEDLIRHLGITYDVNIIKFSIGETIKNDSLDWIFTERAEAVWYDEITESEYEIELKPKIVA